MNPDTNPLFDPKHYNLPAHKGKVVQPMPDKDVKTDGSSPAIELVRQKIQNIYTYEPDALAEENDAEKAGNHRSRHQQFMYELSISGKSLAEIQTAWHNYYTGLPDNEKHQVWQEFYENHAKQSHYAKAQESATQDTKLHSANYAESATHQYTKSVPNRSVAAIKEHVVKRVSSRAKLQRKDHLKSLTFGLGMGSIVVIILLFSFFNERFIAPFITPSKSVSSTAIVINPADSVVGPESKIVIPKINVEAPVVFNEPSIEEQAVQRALESGVLHYATTPNPGELGNGAIFGHSSGNIFNAGKYKFAFILLKSLSNGDVFYVQKDGKRYAYKVFEKKIVRPEEVSVLNNIEGKSATMTLITCDPPGTSVNRLVVVGEQISPDPNANVASTVNQNEQSKPTTLPSNSQSLWSRMWGWLTS